MSDLEAVVIVATFILMLIAHILLSFRVWALEERVKQLEEE